MRTLALLHADTRVTLKLDFNDAYHGAHICFAVRDGGGCRDVTSRRDESWWNELYYSNDM